MMNKADFAATGGSVSRPRSYREEVDGLRAVAVLLVVAFHLVLSKFGQGGFIGVDVFFVISGYLITGHLRHDLKSGWAGVADFYSRRVARIFPALFAMYLFCYVIEISIRFPQNLKGFGATLMASVLFVSNHYMYSKFGYFDFEARINPLVHTWSLSIEEQFYLFLPLVLFAIAKAPAKVQWRILATIAAASLFAAEATLKVDARASFFWLPLRAWELLAGSLASFGGATIFRKRMLAEAAGIVGMALILYAGMTFSGNNFPGFRAGIPVAGTLLILLSTDHHKTLIRYLLSLRPAVAIGRISYSLYLWHWPLIVYGAYVNFPVDRTGKLAMLAISMAVAWMSWLVVEQPTRRMARALPRIRVLQLGLVAIVSTIGLVLLLPSIGALIWKSDPAANRILGTLQFRGDAMMRAGSCFIVEKTDAFDAKTCLRTRNDQPNVLVLGDSHAAQLWRALSHRYPGINFMQATGGSCGPGNRGDQDSCGRMMRMVLDDFLPRAQPDAVILTQRWGPNAANDILPAINTLRAASRNVIVLGPTPVYSLPVADIEARAEYRKQPAFGDQYLIAEDAALDTRMAAAVRHSGARYISAYKILCAERCIRRDRQGVLLMYDNDHLTPRGAALLVSALPKDIFQGYRNVPGGKR